jgi:hypothetical protein
MRPISKSKKNRSICTKRLIPKGILLLSAKKDPKAVKRFFFKNFQKELYSDSHRRININKEWGKSPFFVASINTQEYKND